MIEINSEKIDKALFEKEIDKNIDSFSPKLNIKRKKKQSKSKVEPSLREHYSIVYKILKMIEHFLNIIGLYKIVFILKKALSGINFKKSNVYTVDDFYKYHDEEFIKNIYLGVLKRDADTPSLEHHLHLLRSGLKSKSEILASIRFSKEGRIYSVPIVGIKIRYIMALMYKIPFISYIAKSIVLLLTLPKLMRKYNNLEAIYLMNNLNLNNELAKKVNINDFRQDLSTLEELLSDNYNKSMQLIKDNYNKTQEDYNKTQEDYNKTQEDYNKTQEDYNKTQEDYNQILKKVELYMGDVNNAKSYLRDTQRSLKNLIEQIEYSSQKEKPINNEVVKELLKAKEHLLDDLYISFEDKFRGSREDIKERQKYYLPSIKRVIENSSDIVVDVGCGRGEWIELLKENLIQAKGVDLNLSMANKSIEYGLDVTTMDAITYLKSLKDESIGAITGFHIVEHLPFEVLIALFDESLRVLKKGGMIIFETPNPENLLVGSCTFYTDPTHINPIPPITLEFLAQNRGFCNVEVHRLHPIKEPQYIEGLNRDDINNLIYASTKEQDYSIIGYKI